MIIRNLDVECAKAGFDIASEGANPKETETAITKALGVLEEQGVYAMFLYLHAKENGRFSEKLVDLIRHHVPGQIARGKPEDLFGEIRDLATDLDGLLFAQTLIHQALVYGRYHAKARGQEDRRSETDQGTPQEPSETPPEVGKS